MMQERQVRLVTGHRGLSQSYVPFAEYPVSYRSSQACPTCDAASGLGAMDTDKATLFIIIGVGLIIAGAATMNQ